MTADAACAHLLQANAPDALPDTLKVVSTLLSNLAREDSAKFRRVNVRAWSAPQNPRVSLSPV